MLGPPVGGMPLEVGQGGGWESDAENNNPNNATNIAVWRERERRQRTVRVLMMFLLMLLLMDGEEGNNSSAARNRNRGGGPGGLRKRNQKKGNSANNSKPLDVEVFEARQKQDEMLKEIAVTHPRYLKLIEKNGNKDYEREVTEWSELQAEQEKDEFVESIQQQTLPHPVQSTAASNIGAGAAIRQMQRDPSEDKKVYHYPWNSTGFYRGSWVRSSGASTSSNSKSLLSGSNKDTTTSTGTVPTTKGSVTTLAATPAADNSSSSSKNGRQRLDAISLESDMLNALVDRKEKVGVFVLPPGKEILMRDDNNLTTLNWEAMTVDAAGRTYRPLLQQHRRHQQLNKDGTNRQEISNGGSNNKNNKEPTVTLAHESGRAAFQIFSHNIPSMSQLSLVDGFVKLYDSPNPGYSTRKDILLRVRGVHVHSIGRISLVSANVDASRSAFVVEGKPTASAAATATTSSSTTSITSAVGDTEAHNSDDEDRRNHQRRRLLENLKKVVKEEEEGNEKADNSDSTTTATMNQIRDDAMALFSGADEMPSSETSRGSSFHSPDWREYTEVYDSSNDEEEGVVFGSGGGAEASNDPTEFLQDGSMTNEEPAESIPSDSKAAVAVTRRMVESGSISVASGGSGKDKPLPPWSSIVMPYPFTRDDKEESIRRERTPGARRMPPREQLLEANAADCEFEINMDVQEVEWTVGSWRNLLTRRFREAKKLDPSSQHQATADPDTDDKHASGSSRGSFARPNIRGSRAKANTKASQDEALVITIIGTIKSNNCNFNAALNATALRTDWEATTAKAINYSFFMMLVCLTQILVLLRQLLHSQSQSMATRVSLLCIGWQTVIDALLCLVHIYLSLAMQPLFTAFASVAFFKLLIFCVIEMKYMAMVIQARNSSNGGQSTEVLRRQIAMLHLRFYVALFGTFLLVFYIGEKYRVIYALVLYSFWVPQIVFNIYTEARTPLHTYYIYGMSLSRLVPPLYMFGTSNNFVKEVYPDFTSDTLMCEVLVLWVAFQAAILIAQGKYGARFMIPARFLPPKFDYSRPLPPSMYQNLDSASAAATTLSVMDKSTRNESSPDTEPLVSSSSSEGLSHSSAASPSRTDRHTTAVTTRNRGRGGGRNRSQGGAMISRHHHTEHQSASTMTKEGVVNVGLQESNQPATLPVPPQHSLDCSICYDSIDTRNRSGYMLAPCDHIFHRDCLIQWMDVKMECPICRMELPAL